VRERVDVRDSLGAVSECYTAMDARGPGSHRSGPEKLNASTRCPVTTRFAPYVPPFTSGERVPETVVSNCNEVAVSVRF